jgi:hypothetical protein
LDTNYFWNHYIDTIYTLTDCALIFSGTLTLRLYGLGHSIYYPHPPPMDERIPTGQILGLRGFLPVRYWELADSLGPIPTGHLTEARFLWVTF